MRSELFDAAQNRDSHRSARQAVAIPLTADQRVQMQPRKLAIVWFIFAAILVVWASTRFAQGQDAAAKKDPFQARDAVKSPSAVKQMESAVRTLATARDMAKLDPRVSSMVRTYLAEYVPWRITTKKDRHEIAPLINGLIEQDDRALAMKSPGRTDLLRSLFPMLQRVATADVDPAARVAAIIGLGRLNETGYDANARRPPIPLRYSLPILLQLYENAGNPDGIRAAALQGIERHATYAFDRMTPDQRQKITGLMNDLLSQPAPDGRDPTAHAYLQRTAVDSLNMLRSNQDVSLATQLISISSDKGRHDLIALHSAKRLGDFKQDIANKVTDVSPILTQWSQRIFEAIDSELARIAAMKKKTNAMVKQPPGPERFLQKSQDADAPKAPRPGMMDDMDMMGMEEEMMMDDEMEMDMMGMMEGMDGMDGMDGMMMGGMMGGMGVPQSKPQPPVVSLSRRHIDYVIQQLFYGATGSAEGKADPNKPAGLLAALAEDQKPKLTEWLEKLFPVVDALNDPTLDNEEKWVKALESQRIEMALIAGVEIEDAAVVDDEAEDPDAEDVKGLFEMMGG
ncbi:MAG: hypothetical protein AAGD07_23160 [Planctomycetota bacterium]